MNYVYKNITTVHDTKLNVSTTPDNNITLHKVQMANVSGSDSTVDLYIEHIDIDETVRLHGSVDNGNYNEDTDNFNTKVSEIYYHIKNVVIPSGTTLVLFSDSPCTYQGKYDLIVKSTQNIDVAVSYEIVTPTGVNRNARSVGENIARTLNQY
jgi:hypothetical protein